MLDWDWSGKPSQAGHGCERFACNKVAGAWGIDLALTVVVADDGARVQTVEHVQILGHIDVRSRPAEPTSVDRVDASKWSQVRSQIQELVAETTTEDLDVIEASPVTREGMAAVCSWLHSSAV